MEVLGQYSNLTGQVKRLEAIAQTELRESVPSKLIPPKQIHRRLRRDQIVALVASYEQGQTVYQLADEFRVGRGTVSKLLKAEGVVMRYRSLTDSELQQASQLYVNGLSIIRVAEELGLNHTAVYNALRSAGVTLRKRPGWRVTDTRLQSLNPSLGYEHRAPDRPAVLKEQPM